MYSFEPVNYDLSQGLDLHHHSIQGNYDDRTVRMSGEELMEPIASDDIREDVYESLNVDDRFAGRMDKQVHYALVNNDVANSDITIFDLQFTGHFHDQGVQAGITELVAANPNRRFLVYDKLGFGQSDSMPKSMAKEIARTGRFDNYAEIVYKALSHIIKDHDRLDIVARSEGGLIGTELVAQAGEVGSLVVFDPPATPLPFHSLSKRFIVLEKAHGLGYLKALQDYGTQMPEWNLSTPQLLLSVVEDVVTGQIAIMKREAQGLSRGAYEQALTEALQYITERYVFLAPQQTEMNVAGFINVMINRATKNAQEDARYSR